jgi:hypothetical protein|tara:strand:- start:786 stop:1379 length:594 start_codon:yes stop_codon:yes gene_type:complete
MNISEGINAYKTYLAIKQHFTSNYDYQKYNGKVKATEESFLKRRDRFFFKKLEKKYSKQELEMYFVSNFINSTSKWIGNLLSQDSEKIFLDYKKNQQSLTYSFKNQLQFLKDTKLKNKLFEVKNGHPELFKYYLQGKVSLQTILILNDELNFISHWNSEMTDIVWDNEYKKISKYKSFFEYDKQLFKNIIKEVFNVV